jgi:hypothetical protein
MGQGDRGRQVAAIDLEDPRNRSAAVMLIGFLVTIFAANFAIGGKALQHGRPGGLRRPNPLTIDEAPVSAAPTLWFPYPLAGDLIAKRRRA